MIRVLVSSCLLGERVRYDGRHAHSDDLVLARWLEEGRVIPLCPEVAGGLPVPRPPAEIRGEGGGAVIDGKAEVVDSRGRPVTRFFLAGARKALEAAEEGGARLAILADGSPSCGSRKIYDGSFGGVRKPGEGVTTALLERNGIRVFGLDGTGQAAALLARLETEAERRGDVLS